MCPLGYQKPVGSFTRLVSYFLQETLHFPDSLDSKNKRLPKFYQNETRPKKFTKILTTVLLPYFEIQLANLVRNRSETEELEKGSEK